MSGLQLVEVIILKTALVKITTHWLALYFIVKKILIIKNLYTSGFSRLKYLATGFLGEKESGGRGRKVVYGELDGPVEWIVTTSPSQKLL